MAPKLWRESYSAKGMHALIDYHRSDILPSNVERLWIGVSVLRTGRGRAGGGGGGEVEFLTEKKNSAKKCSWGLKTQKCSVFFPTKFFFRNVPGVAKKYIFRGGGGVWGVWGALRPHPGVARGQKTIHIFL